MSDLLGLYCWVMGDETQQYFPIKILHTEDVGTLKDYIKEKKKPQLDQLPANALKLWKVSIPIGEVDTRLPAFQPVEDRSNGVLRLSPGDDLIDVFPDGPPRKQIHIIVQVSSPQPISEEETKQNMEAYLGGKCKTMMDKVISGECALPTFGSTDIPSINDFPSLLLHNIGVFSEEVEQRISKVFTKKTTCVFTSVIVFELQVDLLT
jgi:hypothetical protein